MFHDRGPFTALRMIAGLFILNAVKGLNRTASGFNVFFKAYPAVAI
jgi:hypothetical protein